MNHTKITHSLIQVRAYKAIASENAIIRSAGTKVLLMSQQSFSVRAITATAYWSLIS